MADVLDTVEQALVDHFGHRPQRASVSFLGVDRIEVLRFEPIPGERAYVSLGMSRHPMTGAEQAVVATDGPRAELALHFRDPVDDYADVWRKLAILAAAPAVEGIVHAAGRTVDLGEPLVTGSLCSGVLLASSPIADVVTTEGEVSVLQALPVTANELAWARVRGADALRERLESPDVDLLDLGRAGVDLS
ncbi:suppressor of fused domain protein [Jatrophihabitans fulvus]